MHLPTLTMFDELYFFDHDWSIALFGNVLDLRSQYPLCNWYFNTQGTRGVQSSLYPLLRLMLFLQRKG